jgi:predicted RNA binding protein YcfA (HicA-like mRNA interferase family)
MLSARAAELTRLASKLGFERSRQTGSHERWVHQDGRPATIPIHGNQEIGGPLLYRVLPQLGMDLDTFQRMK